MESYLPESPILAVPRRRTRPPYFRYLQGLKRQADVRLERLVALQAMEMLMNAALDLDVVLDLFLVQVTAQLRVDAACLWLSPPVSGTERSAETENLRLISARGFRQPPPAVLTPALRRVCYEHQLVILDDESDHFRCDAAWAGREGLVSYWGIPLMAQGQLKAVLELYHRQPLQRDEEWLKFMESLAAQAAIAIHNAELIEDLQTSNRAMLAAYDNTIAGWSHALELRDQETAGHSQRVTEVTLAIARRLGFQGEQLDHLRRGVLLHDIGKMAIPDAILLKPGPLTEEEFALMRQHPVFAYQLLAPIPFLQPALDIPYCHHERWDGSGYPRGLAGEDIPLAARIFAVVDVWDALISDRPYRKAWPVGKVSTYIQDQSGKHFDPAVVRVFMELLAQEPAG